MVILLKFNYLTLLILIYTRALFQCDLVVPRPKKLYESATSAYWLLLRIHASTVIQFPHQRSNKAVIGSKIARLF